MAAIDGIRSPRLSNSARGLKRNPGFASVAIATLAIGIGATTAGAFRIQLPDLDVFGSGFPASMTLVNRDLTQYRQRNRGVLQSGSAETNRAMRIDLGRNSGERQVSQRSNTMNETSPSGSWIFATRCTPNLKAGAASISSTSPTTTLCSGIAG